MRKKGIWAAGNILVDQIKLIDRWPEEETLTLTEAPHFSPGGGAVNLVLNLNKVDPDIPLFLGGKIGNDYLGDFLLKAFEGTGVDYSFILQCQEHATSWTDVMTEKSTKKRTFFYHAGASDDYRIDDIFRSLFSSGENFLSRVPLSAKKMDEKDDYFGCKAGKLLHTLKESGYITVIDCVSSDNMDFMRKTLLSTLKYVDVFILNEGEASLITGETVKDEHNHICAKGLERAISKLAHYSDATIVVHFPQGGVSYHEGRIRYHRSYFTPKHEIQGSVGAGDAFSSGFLYGLHEGYTIGDAVDFGSAVARFNLLHLSATEGAKPLSEIQNWMRTAVKREAWYK